MILHQEIPLESPLILRIRAGLLILLMLSLTGCAGLMQREAVRVSVAGIEPLQGEGLEARFLVKLRIQNPNDTPIEYNGIFVELELGGRDFGSGVSDQRGRVPRFGERVVSVPMVVPFTSVVRQLFGLAGRKEPLERLQYRLRGKLGGMGLGGISFEKEGELALNPDEDLR